MCLWYSIRMEHTKRNAFTGQSGGQKRFLLLLGSSRLGGRSILRRGGSLGGGRAGCLILRVVIAPRYRRRTGGIKDLGSVKEIRQPLFGRIRLDHILVQTIAVQVPPGHSQVVWTLLDPGRLAGVYIAEIPETFGAEVLIAVVFI